MKAVSLIIVNELINKPCLARVEQINRKVLEQLLGIIVTHRAERHVDKFAFKLH